MKPTNNEAAYNDFKLMTYEEVYAKRPDRTDESIKFFWEKSVLSKYPKNEEERSRILLESSYKALCKPEEFEQEFFITLGEEEIYKVQNGQIITDSLDLHQTINQIMVQKMAGEVDTQKFLTDLSQLAKNKLDGKGVILFGNQKYFLQMNKGEPVLLNSSSQEIVNKDGCTITCTMKDLEAVMFLESKFDDLAQKLGSKPKL